MFKRSGAGVNINIVENDVDFIEYELHIYFYHQHIKCMNVEYQKLQITNSAPKRNSFKSSREHNTGSGV